MELIIFDMEGTLTHEDQALPWTERLLEVLERTGVKLAVVSDLPEDSIRAKLTGAGIDAEKFLCISNAHYAEGFAKAAELAGTTAEKTVVCSASAVGVKITKRCGMTSVAVRTHFAKDFYVKAGADHVCEDLDALPDFLGFKD